MGFLRQRQQPAQQIILPSPTEAETPDDDQVSVDESERRRRRLALSGIVTGALGAGTTQQTARSRLLGA